MSKEIPQTGWCVLKNGNDSFVGDTTVYFDGKKVKGIQKVSVEFDANKTLVVLKLEVVPFGGLVVDTVFGSTTCQPEVPPTTTIYRSSQSPEQILNSLETNGTKTTENKPL